MRNGREGKCRGEDARKRRNKKMQKMKGYIGHYMEDKKR